MSGEQTDASETAETGGGGAVTDGTVPDRTAPHALAKPPLATHPLATRWIAALACVVLASSVVLAGWRSASALLANRYLELGLQRLAALTLVGEIESALVQSLLAAAALLAGLGGLALLLRVGAASAALASPLAAVRTAIDRARLPMARGLARLPLWTLAAGAALLLAATHLAALRAAAVPIPTGPNVLLIVMDTVRKANVSVYGHAHQTTPNIDRFARDAIVFENAFAIGPWTIPNHASMFTGLYACQHGATQESKYLHASALTAAELLAERGYATAGFTNNANVSSAKGFSQGFLEYQDMWRGAVQRRFAGGGDAPDGDAGAFATTRAVLGWLEGRPEPERPWLLFVNYIEPHSPYRPPSGSVDALAADAPAALPGPADDAPHRVREYDYVDFLAGAYRMSDADFRMAEALYDAEIHYLDEQIGELLAALEARGALAETLVIITSDHGESFGEHGLVGHQFGLYDPVLRVPLIVRAPGEARGGSRSEARVELLDVFATVLEAAGVEPPSSLASESRSVLAGADRERVVAEYYRPLKYLRKLAERHPEFDASAYDRRIRTLREGDHKLIWSSDGRHELYDLAADPSETRDLAGRDAQRVAQLAGEVERWLEARREAHAAPEAAPEGEPEIDDEMREELRALGYVE